MHRLSEDGILTIRKDGSNKYSYTDPNLADRFLDYCIDNDYTIGYAWQVATLEVLEGDGAFVRVVFDTNDQLVGDHLPGLGTVSGSEIIDDDTIYYDDWYT